MSYYNYRGSNKSYYNSYTRNNYDTKKKYILHVKNIDPSITPDFLKGLFSPFGANISVKWLGTNWNTNCSAATVGFESRAEADEARARLNHKRVGIKEINISEYSQDANADSKENKCNLVVKKIHPKVGGREFQQYCEEFGKVINCIIKDDPEGNSLCYGYVEFEDEIGAELMLRDIGKYPLRETIMIAEVKVPREEREQQKETNYDNCTLYLKGFPEQMSATDIEKLVKKKFAKFGVISSISVQMNNELAKYFAVIKFATSEQASEAKKEMNDYKFPFGEEVLFVDFIKAKQDRIVEKFDKQKQENKLTNVYMRSIKDTATEDDVYAAFEKYGKIKAMKLSFKTFTHPKDPKKSLTLGSAFINFEDPACATKATTDGQADEDVLALLEASHDRSIE